MRRRSTRIAAEDVVFATGRHMPRPDPETPLLIAALRDRGIRSSLRPWDDAVGWADVPLVVVRTTWDYHERRDEFLVWAHGVERVTQLVNPASTLDWNSHKKYLFDLQRAGVPIIATTLLQQGCSDADHKIALREYPGEVVIKPAVSIGARGALRALGRSTEAAEHLARSTAVGDVLIQPFEHTVLTEGEASLIFFAGQFSHAVRKIPADGDYRVHARYGGRVVPHDPTPKQLRVASAAVSLAPAATPAYARVDLVRLQDEPAVMELEVIEPELFLGYHHAAVDRFTDHLADLLAAIRSSPA